jgi:hypothetical protein
MNEDAFALCAPGFAELRQLRVGGLRARNYFALSLASAVSSQQRRSLYPSRS